MSSSLNDILSFQKVTSITATAAAGGGGTTTSISNKIGKRLSCSTPSTIFTYQPSNQSLTLYKKVITTNENNNNDDDDSISIQQVCNQIIHVNNVVQIACSSNGRIVALIDSDLILYCYNVTFHSFTLRWTMDMKDYDASTVTTTNATNALSGNVHNGPIHSFAFQPIIPATATIHTNPYILLINNGLTGNIFIINCASSHSQNAILYNHHQQQHQQHQFHQQQQKQHIISASWSYNGTSICIGLLNGQLDILQYQYQHNHEQHTVIVQKSKSNDVMIDTLPSFVSDDNDNTRLWSCTHIDWFHENYIAMGYCQTISNEESIEQIQEQNNEYDSDVDDLQDHDIQFVIYDLKNQSWSELGDVVPFFTLPYHGRHVFYTQYLPLCNDEKDGLEMMLVGCNVSSDVVLIHKDNTMNEWEICDLEQETMITTPTTEDDEFTNILGINYIVHSDKQVQIVLFTTDESLSVYNIFDTMEDDIFGSVNVDYIQNATFMITDNAIEDMNTYQTHISNNQTAVKDTNEDDSLPFGGLNICSPQGQGDVNKKSDKQQAFGFSTNNSTTSASPFQSSTFGSTFGSNTPVFGSGTKAPVFGSGTTTPVFGSGSKTSIFGQSTADTTNNETSSDTAKPAFGGGFAALAKNPVSFGTVAASTDKQSTGFSFGTVMATSSDNTKSTGFGFGSSNPNKPTSIFGQSTASPFDSSSMTKSLFGVSVKDKTRNETERKVDNHAMKLRTSESESIASSDSDDQDDTSDHCDVDLSSSEAQNAATAFDTIDTNKQGTLLTDQFEQLLDEVGEGFHGDELDKQISLLDPESTGKIGRSAFITWYCKLVGGDADNDHSDGASLDTEEREEREEEKNKAIQAFKTVAASGVVTKANFKDLMEAMGTTYCEEEHRRTIKKLSDKQGNITQQVFVEWYVEWIFGDGDDSDYSDGADSDAGATDANDKDNASGAKAASHTTAGWGNIFVTDTSSWKCESCMVQNKEGDTKCAACETIRPGCEDTSSKSDQSKQSAPIVKSNFTFSAADAGQTGSTGFSFSAAGASDQNTPSATSGFTFGTAGSGKSSGFIFNAAGASDQSTPSSTSGFTFSAAGASEQSKTSSSSSAGAYPPMSTVAPKPFGASKPATTAKSTTSSSSSSASAYPTSKMNLNILKPKDIVMSEFENQFWCLVSDYDTSLCELEVLIKEFVSNSSNDCQEDIDRLFASQERLHSTASLISDTFDQYSRSSILLLGTNDDLSRQIEESKMHIDTQINGLKEDSLSSIQPLDLESEKCRTHLMLKLNLTRNHLLKLKKSISFADGLWGKNCSRNKKTASTKALFLSLQNEYDRTLAFEKRLSNVSDKVNSMFTGELPLLSKLTIGSNVKKSGKTTLSSLPLFASPTSLSKLVHKHSHESVRAPSLADLRQLKSTETKVITKTFNRKDMSGYTRKDITTKSATSWRSSQSAEIMDSLSTSNFNRNESILSSPVLRKGKTQSQDPSNLDVRQGWNGIQATNDLVSTTSSFTMPQNLKTLDIRKVEKEVLSAFGTTPDKMAQVREAKKREEAKKKEENKNGFVSLQSGNLKIAAPTPREISQSQPSRTKQNASSAYPPLSKAAPTPFNQQGTASKTVSTKKENNITPESSEKVIAAKNSSNKSINQPLSSKSLAAPLNISSKKDEAKLAAAKPFGSLDDKSTADGKVVSSGLFGNLSGMQDSLNSTMKSSALLSNEKGSTLEQNSGANNYRNILTQFYQKHNPSKISEVDKNLEKFKVRKFLERI